MLVGDEVVEVPDGGFTRKVPASVPSELHKSVRKVVTPDGMEAEKNTRWFATVNPVGLELRSTMVAGLVPTLPVAKLKYLCPPVFTVPLRVKVVATGSTPCGVVAE